MFGSSHLMYSKTNSSANGQQLALRGCMSLLDFRPTLFLTNSCQILDLAVNCCSKRVELRKLAAIALNPLLYGTNWETSPNYPTRCIQLLLTLLNDPDPAVVIIACNVR